MTQPTANRVLFIGWDGADWKVITPLLDAGTMPNLERLIDGGVMGNLATLQPDLSPMLWTSIVTGKRPFKHGIWGCTEPDPPDRQIDAIEAQEALNQLVALGYIEKPDENREKGVAQTVRELHYNLARSYMDADWHGQAAELLAGEAR